MVVGGVRSGGLVFRCYSFGGGGGVAPAAVPAVCCGGNGSDSGLVVCIFS
jgi:hypothetical protein